MDDEVEMVFGTADIDVVGVKALNGFRIWVKLSNGVEGELDLTEYAGKPWFQLWQDRKVFESCGYLLMVETFVGAMIPKKATWFSA